MDFDADNQNLIGIFTTDERFFVRVWDAALAQMSGISAEEARGKPVFETIPDLEARGLRARFERVLMDGTIEILSPAFHRFLIECPPLLPSRHFSEMRQRVTIAPLREDEMIRGLLVTIEDVTARIEREIELTEQLKDADEAIRLRAAKHISRAPENLGEETAAPIIDALGDKNWRVRRELVEGLARRAAPEAIAALLRAMQERHLDFGVLNSALRVLQATSVKTTETLIEFLRGDDADLRMQAALTLGEQRAAPAIPALIEALADEDANER
jgi:PAS domain S-box-containing protein